MLCRRLGLYGRELLAVDGTRIKAVNNKDRNFTRSSLRAFIRAADERLDDYLGAARRQPSRTATVCEVDRARKRAASRDRAQTSDTEQPAGVTDARKRYA